MNKLYLNKLVEVCVNNYDARFENNKPNLIASILDINTHNKNSYVVEETNYESIASYANNLNKVSPFFSHILALVPKVPLSIVNRGFIIPAPLSA